MRRCRCQRGVHTAVPGAFREPHGNRGSGGCRRHGRRRNDATAPLRASLHSYVRARNPWGSSTLSSSRCLVARRACSGAERVDAIPNASDNHEIVCGRWSSSTREPSLSSGGSLNRRSPPKASETLRRSQPALFGRRLWHHHSNRDGYAFVQVSRQDLDKTLYGLIQASSENDFARAIGGSRWSGEWDRTAGALRATTS